MMLVTTLPSSFETAAMRLPQDEDAFHTCFNPHGEERGAAARLEPCSN
jgi:hypothetical protein